MSLLMKALKNAERPPGKVGNGGTDWSLEPMESGASASGMPPRTAQAAADLIRANEASNEGTRLAILLGVLVLVVVGMGGYFYVAVYMPWLLVPQPTSSPQPITVTSTPASPAPEPLALPVMEPAASLAAPVPAADSEEMVELKPLPAAKPVAPSAVAKPTVERPPRMVTPANAAAADGVMAAYELLQVGRLDQARDAYEKMRIAQPGNPDVLLGLAAIAQRQNRVDEAARLYLHALELDSHNSFAQAGLVSLIGRADPVAAETKLKQLIAERPAAFLHFALGNLYAAQGRWSEAQTSYFEAQRNKPDSADYCFNLAVSLEHINQPRIAAEYYQRALRLAQGSSVSFDPAQARSRLQQLNRP